MKEDIYSVNLVKLNKEYLDACNLSNYNTIKDRQNRINNKDRFSLRYYLKKYGIFKGFNRVLEFLYYKSHQDKLIDKNIKYNPNDMSELEKLTFENHGRIVIYTAIFGKYDNVWEPLYQNPLCDFYIITDGDVPIDSIWKKWDYSQCHEMCKLDDYHKARYAKVHPHILFPEYEYSIWIDGNIQVIGDIYPLIQRLNGKSIGMFDHPLRDCIYLEARTVIFNRRANKEKVELQMKKYKENGFPKHFGLWESGIMIRKHKDMNCIVVMDEWWNQLSKYTMRDQLSLPYVLFSLGKLPNTIEILGKNLRWNPRFRFREHKLIC